MSSILFAFAGVAFLLIAHWAYTNDRLRADAPDLGLLKMKSNAAPADPSKVDGGKGEKARKRVGLAPKWKRSEPRRRR